MKEQHNKLSYYLNAAKSTDAQKYDKKIRVALLGSFTLNGMEETFRVKCSEFGVGCITYVSGYNQYNQEIFNIQSELYKFAPNVTFLMLDTRSILGQLFYSPYTLSESDRRQVIKKRISEVSDLIKSFISNTKSKLVITNLMIPSYSTHGILETKTSYGLKEMTNDFNAKLYSISKLSDSVYVYDMNGFVTRFGEQNIFNYHQYFSGDVKISFDYIPYLIHDLVGYIKAILGLNKKCIVLDLDNTLWGGVVGEDGLEGIKLGNNPVGRAFVEFQNVLLALHQRGIILAINSKNNFEDVIRVIREHPDMVLKEEHFASMRINWDDKIANIKEIAAELNIGLDSMVFLDDDPVNREYLRRNLPQVLTIDFPDDVSEYAQTVRSMNDFELLKITEEDLGRGTMYLQDKQRKDLEKSTENLEDFLKQLDIKLTIKKADEFTIPRISQLTLKTNQFNLTTRRYQEEDIRKFLNQGSYLIGCAQVQDKFGDNGITGVFIVKKDKNAWLIDTFLLSCRIIGRGVEDGIIAYILKKAKEEGASFVKSEFIPTSKNKPCENFLSDYGFKKDVQYWIFDLTNSTIKTPSHLNLVIDK